MKEGRKEGRERERGPKSKLKEWNPKCVTRGSIVEVLMFQNFVPQSREACEKKKGMRNLKKTKSSKKNLHTKSLVPYISKKPLQIWEHMGT